MRRDLSAIFQRHVGEEALISANEVTAEERARQDHGSMIANSARSGEKGYQYGGDIRAYLRG
jgi:hypothetical protein